MIYMCALKNYINISSMSNQIVEFLTYFRNTHNLNINQLHLLTMISHITLIINLLLERSNNNNSTYRSLNNRKLELQILALINRSQVMQIHCLLLVFQIVVIILSLAIKKRIRFHKNPTIIITIQYHTIIQQKSMQPRSLPIQSDKKVHLL